MRVQTVIFFHTLSRESVSCLGEPESAIETTIVLFMVRKINPIHCAPIANARSCRERAKERIVKGGS
jgi:hypothetical protein